MFWKIRYKVDSTVLYRVLEGSNATVMTSPNSKACLALTMNIINKDVTILITYILMADRYVSFAKNILQFSSGFFNCSILPTKS